MTGRDHLATTKKHDDIKARQTVKARRPSTATGSTKKHDNNKA